MKKLSKKISEPIIGKLKSVASKSFYDEGGYHGRLLLLGDKTDEFHLVTAKLLHISKRSRPNADTLVAYLTTRVTKSTNYDWYKLKRGLKWLKQKINDERISGVVGEGIIQTWIYVSYGVHVDMRGQTGGAISMGRGTLMNKSMKKKLNTKSSPETEVIGVSDIVPYVLWLANFFKM